MRRGSIVVDGAVDGDFFRFLDRGFYKSGVISNFCSGT